LRGEAPCSAGAAGGARGGVEIELRSACQPQARALDEVEEQQFGPWLKAKLAQGVEHVVAGGARRWGHRRLDERWRRWMCFGQLG
jgi:hypothetical protein